MSMVKKILKMHQRYGWTEQGGEWGWIQDTARAGLRVVLDAGDEAGLAALLDQFFQNPVCGGLVSFSYREMREQGWSKLFTKDMLRNVGLWELHTGSSDIARLESPGVGAPLVGECEGVSVQYGTPRHDHYATRIAKLLPHGGTVVEIGGGYGGTALQLLRQRPDARYVIIDIPETLYLAWYWLDAAGMDVGWWDDLKRVSDVTLVAASDMVALVRPDVVFSAHALCEMPREIVDGYMARIRKMEPRYFYHDSAHDMGIVSHPEYKGSTAEAFPEVQAMELDPGEAYREVYRAPTLWPGTGGRYWEFLYERRR